MTATQDNLPISETIAPETTTELQQLMTDCFHDQQVIYPLGGQTSLDFGLPAKKTGIGLSLEQLDVVIDYPARDLTITVEAGMTIAKINSILAEENQELPLDVPFAEIATIGGVIATNWNGFRRLGCGTVRDHLIGIEAVNGKGQLFHGGGRVVKNVAGYDFCKLLTGSLGTLGIITQATLKVRPIPSNRQWLLLNLNEYDTTSTILNQLHASSVVPTAVEVIQGQLLQSVVEDLDISLNPDSHLLAILLSGTEAEVSWMQKQLQDLVSKSSLTKMAALSDEQQLRFIDLLAQFPATNSENDGQVFTLKITATNQKIIPLLESIQSFPGTSSTIAHAFSGAIHWQLLDIQADQLAKLIHDQLLPIAGSVGGNVMIVSSPSDWQSTQQLTWGGIGVPFDLMNRVKEQFDPTNILNPDRFVYR